MNGPQQQKVPFFYLIPLHSRDNLFQKGYKLLTGLGEGFFGIVIFPK